MAEIHISDLQSARAAFISDRDAFDQAVSNSVMRAIDARQQQQIRGGLLPLKGVILTGAINPEILEALKLPGTLPQLPGELV